MPAVSSRTLFIDSADSDARAESSSLNIELSDPISAENEQNTLWIGIKSFTFTNFIYNIASQDILSFYIVYDASKTSYPNKASFYETVNLSLTEGQYSGPDLESEWSSLRTDSSGSVLATAKINTTGYTDSNATNTKILPMLDYLDHSGKMKWSWSTSTTTTYYDLLTTQVNDNSYRCPHPTQIFIPVTSLTKTMLTRLGFYQDGDALTVAPSILNSSATGLLYTFTFTTSISGSNTRFTMGQLSATSTYPFREASVQYIDIGCEQVPGYHFKTSLDTCTRSSLLGRVPILATFGQTQSVYYDTVIWCPVSSPHIHNLQFTLANPYTTMKIFSCPLQLEIVIEEREKDLLNLSKDPNQQRLTNPITYQGKRFIDPLNPVQNRATPSQKIFRSMDNNYL